MGMSGGRGSIVIPYCRLLCSSLIHPWLTKSTIVKTVEVWSEESSSWARPKEASQWDMIIRITACNLKISWDVRRNGVPYVVSSSYGMSAVLLRQSLGLGLRNKVTSVGCLPPRASVISDRMLCDLGCHASFHGVKSLRAAELDFGSEIHPIRVNNSDTDMCLTMKVLSHLQLLYDSLRYWIRTPRSPKDKTWSKALNFKLPFFLKLDHCVWLRSC